MSDSKYMNLALELAERGTGFTSPNPLVGAVIVKDNQVIGQGWHEHFGQAHAEINALNDAGADTQGATMYVTLEPCSHYGKTPPCVDRIINAGISRVVVSIRDPNPAVNGKGIERLRQRQIKVDIGILEEEALRQNESFIKYITTRLPFVTIKCAATLDGMIATRTGDAKWISNKQSRHLVHQMRQASDAILVGVNTINMDNPRLTTRLERINTKDPVRIVLDSKLSIAADAKILNHTSACPTWIVTGIDIPEEKRKRIEKDNVEIITLPLVDGRVDPNHLMRLLGKRRITSLLIEGGGKIIGSALRAGIVDKMALFYSPRLSGGNDGIPMIAGKGAESASGFINLKNRQLRSLDEDILVEGYISPEISSESATSI